MATSHFILVLIVLAAVLATISATWKDHYPSPSHGGGGGGGQSPPDQYYPPPYDCNGGGGGETTPPYYYGKPPPNKHHKKAPPYDSFPAPCTPPYNNPSPPQPYYPPAAPATKTCPVDAWKLNECADALGGDDPIHLLIGKKKKKEAKAKCCPLFADADDAAACLCAVIVIRERALGADRKKMHVLVALELLKTCGMVKDLLLPHDGSQCLPPLHHPDDSATTHKVDHPAPQLRA